jgi:hypothetical protein
MEPILQAILDDGKLFKDHQQVVKQAMISSIRSTTGLSNLQYSERQELAAIIYSQNLKYQTLLTLSLEYSRIRRSMASQT